MAYLVEARNITKAFVTKTGFFGRAQEYFLALNDVSLAIAPGEVVGLVGESGSGKSTLGRLLVHLMQSDQGQVLFGGQPWLQADRRQYQIIFQDPDSAFDPRWTIGKSMLEGLLVYERGLSKHEQVKRLHQVMELVGLQNSLAHKYPHQLSGGQKQRAAIARALIMQPQFLVLDEVVSALDVSTQAQILALLKQIQQELGLAMLFISHDLAVVASIAQRVAVMWQGKIVEMGPATAVTSAPQHPYTKRLFSAVPTLRPEKKPKLEIDQEELETLSLQQRLPKLTPTSYEAEEIGEGHYIFVP